MVAERCICARALNAWIGRTVSAVPPRRGEPAGGVTDYKGVDMAQVTLTEFLLARIAEDEAAAHKAARQGSGRWGSWNRSWDHEPYRDLADEDAGERIARIHCDLDEHIARHDPARVLAECEAKMRIVEQYSVMRLVEQHRVMRHDADWSGEITETLELSIRALALPYADHPDYLPEWKP